jgi:hypothetical protein
MPWKDAIELLDTSAENIIVNGFKVRTTSLRYETFRAGRTCPDCGSQGTQMALETSRSDMKVNRAHFNLYDESGTLLFNKDHIHPKSKGGLDSLANLRTMCRPCNEQKGNK